MCLFILTEKDGTPFDVTSESEEDIMEICIILGHTHPMSVLLLCNGISSSVLLGRQYAMCYMQSH